MEVGNVALFTAIGGGEPGIGGPTGSPEVISNQDGIICQLIWLVPVGVKCGGFVTTGE